MREDSDRIQDINNAIQKIEKYTSQGQDEFKRD
jgi:uncharacterized protein with HEPN domain